MKEQEIAEKNKEMVGWLMRCRGWGLCSEQCTLTKGGRGNGRGRRSGKQFAGGWLDVWPRRCGLAQSSRAQLVRIRAHEPRRVHRCVGSDNLTGRVGSSNLTGREDTDTDTSAAEALALAQSAGNGYGTV